MAPSFRVRNKKAPMRELFYYYWRRGWDSPTFRRPPVRKYAHGFASHTGAMQMAPSFRVRNKKAPMRELFYYYWRRGWDSNPRYDLTYA